MCGGIMRIILLFVCVFSWGVYSHEESLWTPVLDFSSSVIETKLPERYSLFRINKKLLAKIITSKENHISLPWPDSSIKEYIFSDSELMHPDLKKRHQEIKAFKGYLGSQTQETLRFDTSPQGLFARIRNAEGFIYIMPLIENDNIYIVFNSDDYLFDNDLSCELLDKTNYNEKIESKISYGKTLKTYRTAIAATGEYSAQIEGGKDAVLASIVRALNFINGIFEHDLSVRLQLIANNENIIFTDASTDPYTPSEGTSVLAGQNQSTIDTIIGVANYDIGHLLDARVSSSNITGGAARVGSVCSAIKARAFTRASRVGAIPINPFFYGSFAHELGHQLGAHHSFNASCSGARYDNSAYEPGSGSTIMSYASGCRPYTVQPVKDNYFHRVSLEAIAKFVAGAGSKCGIVTNTGNAIPVAHAGLDYHIPKSTAFVLTGQGRDADLSNTLTYGWEQYNKEIGPTPPEATSLVGPNFRSFVPTLSPMRFFPQLGPNQSIWEVLPSVGRTLNFSLVVRDNVGGASSDDMSVTIHESSGPFEITSPNGKEIRRAFTIVRWNTAKTTLAPINTTRVRILLSIDNGLTFPYLLATNTPNDGIHMVKLPRIQTNDARIQVKAEGNIFYDISNEPFTINY
jgi:hypothetical protein